MDLQPLGQGEGLAGIEGLVERGDAVGVEVVHDQHHGRHPRRGSVNTKIEQMPHRTYSLSRRASRLGRAGIGSRTWPRSWKGFSSMHTTGRAGSYGRA